MDKIYCINCEYCDCENVQITYNGRCQNHCNRPPIKVGERKIPSNAIYPERTVDVFDNENGFDICQIKNMYNNCECFKEA